MDITFKIYNFLQLSFQVFRHILIQTVYTLKLWIYTTLHDLLD